MNRFKGVFIIIAFIATAGFVSTAFAHGGWGGDGYGGHMMGYGYGMGPGMMGYGGYGGYGMGPGMMGYGSYGGYGMGPGMMGYGYGPGYGRYDRGNYPADLSKEDSDRLQQAQDKFFDQTRTLRDEIRDKQFALNDELNNTNPDRTKVAELQKTISKLRSDFDQKALDYRLEVRKILPERTGRSDYAYGFGPGYGCNNW